MPLINQYTMRMLQADAYDQLVKSGALAKAEKSLAITNMKTLKNQIMTDAPLCSTDVVIRTCIDYDTDRIRPEIDAYVKINRTIMFRVTSRNMSRTAYIAMFDFLQAIKNILEEKINQHANVIRPVQDITVKIPYNGKTWTVSIQNLIHRRWHWAYRKSDTWYCSEPMPKNQVARAIAQTIKEYKDILTENSVRRLTALHDELTGKRMDYKQYQVFLREHPERKGVAPA